MKRDYSAVVVKSFIARPVARLSALCLFVMASGAVRAFPAAVDSSSVVADSAYARIADKSTLPAQMPSDSSSVVAPSAPFAFGDFTWMNGQNRASGSLVLNDILTVGVYLDAYYNYSFNRPSDNTVVGSAVTGRHNEFALNIAGISLEANYKNAIGRVLLQTGSMLGIVQETDGTAGRGRNLSTNNLKFIREATLGYHFDVWHGINIETGIFASYIGLESYVTQENWSYQRSFVCDFTPFYFTGARLTMYPTDKLKIEPWLMNGWQSYGKWNNGNSVGLSVYYRPTESLGFIGNFYYGADTKNVSDRVRFNHDNSILVRYYSAPTSDGISKAALSINNHYGFEDGGAGLPGMDSAYFLGTSIATRIWFARDRFAITLRGGGATNPTRYLAPLPTASGFPPGDDNYSLKVWDYTATLDYMPNDLLTMRLEFMNRNASVPYFAGPGGTTSPDGYQGTPGSFTPDLRKSENRLVLAMNFRI